MATEIAIIAVSMLIAAIIALWIAAAIRDADSPRNPHGWD